MNTQYQAIAKESRAMTNRLWLCLAATALVAGAQADDDLRALQKICDYIKVDDRSSLRRTLDETEVDLRREYGDFKCGKYSLLRYAALSGSLEAATLLVSKAGKKAIGDKEGDGMNAIEWAQKQADGADAGLKPKIKAVVDLMQSKQ